MNAILAARPATTSAPAPAPPSPAATTAAPVRAAINTRALGVASLNPLPTTAGPVFQTMQVSLSANSQYLYINFTSYNTFNLNGAPSSAWPRVNFYLDLDNNPATGFQVNNGGTVGSEMLVQGQGMYKQMTGNFNAGSIGTALATGTTNTNSVGIAIPVSTLKAQYAAASTVRVVGHNDQTGQFMPPPTSFLTCTVA